MLKKTGITFFILFSVVGILFPSQRDLRVRRISLQEGLSQSRVPCILQDHKGFMWFGTQDGLNKYDGYAFKTYRPEPGNPNSLSGNDITSIFEDSRGMLWIGALGAGLNKFDREKEKFTHFRFQPGDPTSLSHDIVRVIHEDRSGTLWIGTGDGLNKFHRETGTFTRYPNITGDPSNLGHNRIRVIYEDRSGSFWIGTVNGLNKFHPETGAYTRYPGEPGHQRFSALGGSNQITAIHEDPSGEFWIGTLNGLRRFNPETGKYTVYRSNPAIPGSLGGNVIGGICEDRTGVLWIATVGGGLNTFDRRTGRFVQYRADPKNPGGLNSNRILSIYEDRSGSLWLGTTDNGINRFDREAGKFKHYRNDPDDANSLGYNSVFAIVEDRTGVLWIGTFGRGLDKFDRETGRFTHYRSNPRNPGGLCGDFITTLCEDGAGALWIGTRGTGLDKFNRETGTFINYRGSAGDPSGLSSSIITALYEDSAGTLWVGTIGGGLNKFNRETGTFTAYPFGPNVPGNLGDGIIYSINEGKGDHAALWIGTRDGGLNKYHPQTERFTSYPHDPGDPASLSSNIVMSIYQDPSGIVWAGTLGGGLNKFDPRKKACIHYREQDGLPNDVVYGILADETGCLWLSTNKGISKFDPRTGAFKNYTPADGLQSNEFNAVAYHKSQSGEMFFGGVNGFNAFYPHRVTDNKNIPPIVITDFQIFNKAVAIGGGSPLKKHIAESREITLSYQQNVFSFNFVALDYTIPQKNRYKYKMEGFDKDWVSTPASRRFASYTNLDPGEYVFRVKGSNNDGVWNEEGASVKIFITPPYWRTWWFQGFFIMLAIALTVIFYKIRIRMTYQRMRLETVLQTARTAQMSIMPQADPRLEGFYVSGICEPAHEVGGDFFDYIWLNPEKTKFGIIIGDVSGKAMKAAMTAVLSSGMLYSTIHRGASVEEIMTEVNRPLYSKTDKRMFTALCLASLDLRTKEFVFSNAGLNEPLLKSRGAASYIESLGSKLPLGSFENSTYRETTLQLKPSDVVVLFTDGIPEARNPAGEFYGCDTLKDLVEEMDTHRLSPSDIKQRIIDDVKRFSRGLPQHDDITVVVIKLREQ
jgi:ligand-binding sensor domain-containing protein/serine phosphatase RsbU (regulator of sigma subunit)